MSGGVYLPTDAFSGGRGHDPDLAADYLELAAFLSADRQSFEQDIVDALEQAEDGDFADVDDEIRRRETVSSDAINRVSLRQRILKDSYPFGTDESGHVVTFVGTELSYGQTAYLLSLLLSNLPSVTDLLHNSPGCPNNEQIVKMRLYFQYFATAAMAAEIVGPAWSFGYPRPDRSGFFEKLKSIWGEINDGTINPSSYAPSRPKDGQIDIFARREQRDRLPGFLLAAAQVATGKGWKEKSIQHHANKVFFSRWFSRQPVTRLVPFHVIPFARADDDFPDDVLVLGNVLHRLRVPHRVDEAKALVDREVRIEAYDRLGEAVDLIRSFVGSGEPQ